MENNFNPKNIKQVLDQKLNPTVVMWNRLEGRPRTHHFNRALKSEVRDALWMLTKQWQMGEFKADDAGSPVFTKIHISSSFFDKYKAADKEEQNFENNIPLEVKAEQKKIPFIRDGKEVNIDIRLQMGHYWLKFLNKQSLNFNTKYIEQYPFELPDKTRDTGYIFAHKDVWQQYAAIAGRSMDGYKLFQYISSPGTKASDNITGTELEKSALDDLGEKFKSWFAALYYQPNDQNNNAWLPDRLEYHFECSAKANMEKKTVDAEEYYDGHLDWYAFNLKQESNREIGPSKKTYTNTFIPSHVEYEGMPNTRWWKFEDSKTNLGNIKPSKTDLPKLLLMEFGLVFANDWFLVPQNLPIGSLTNIEGLTVKNNFGETIWINAAEEEKIENLPWSMFKLRSKNQNNTLFLAPSAMKVHEGNPLEEILLIRDEMSNMVWGIETIVPLIIGKGEKGSEVALQVRQYHEKIVNSLIPTVIPYAAKISYLAMTYLPENWIPFIPVHIKNDNREIQLQRASMLRIIEGDTRAPEKIKPQTSILREGLENLNADGIPNPIAYYIHEEEIPRSGIKVIKSFRRTRWTNGEIFIWLGMKKKTGRGEGSSGLSYDQIINVK